MTLASAVLSENVPSAPSPIGTAVDGARTTRPLDVALITPETPEMTTSDAVMPIVPPLVERVAVLEN